MSRETYKSIIYDLLLANIYKADNRSALYMLIAKELYNEHGITKAPDSVRKYVLKHFRNILGSKDTRGEKNTNVDSNKTSASNDSPNHRTYTTDYQRPLTLEEMLEIFEIDTDVWEVERFVCNSWDVTKGSGDTYTNYQTKLWAVRREPIKQFPTITPITGVSYDAKLKTFDNKDHPQKKALILGDAQVGFNRDVRTGELETYHDRLALSVVLAAIEHYQPDQIVILGDMLDLASWSTRWLRHPEFYFTTQAALIELHWWLTQFRKAAPDHCKISYLSGNHEDRLVKAIMTHLNEAYQIRPAHQLEAHPVLSIPSLLNLDGLGIEYIDGYPKGSVWLNDNLECYHGDKARSTSGGTASVVINDARTSKIFGHVHRIESAYKTVTSSQGTKTYSAHTFGCLCKIDGTVPSNSRSENWQQGFGIVYFNNKSFHVVPHYVNNGEAYADGTFLIGDPLYELEEEIVNHLATTYTGFKKSRGEKF